MDQLVKDLWNGHTGINNAAARAIEKLIAENKVLQAENAELQDELSSMHQQSTDQSN